MSDVEQEVGPTTPERSLRPPPLPKAGERPVSAAPPLPSTSASPKIPLVPAATPTPPAAENGAVPTATPQPPSRTLRPIPLDQAVPYAAAAPPPSSGLQPPPVAEPPAAERKTPRRPVRRPSAPAPVWSRTLIALGGLAASLLFGAWLLHYSQTAAPTEDDLHAGKKAAATAARAPGKTDTAASERKAPLSDKELYEELSGLAAKSEPDASEEPPADPASTAPATTASTAPAATPTATTPTVAPAAAASAPAAGSSGGPSIAAVPAAEPTPVVRFPAPRGSALSAANEAVALRYRIQLANAVRVEQKFDLAQSMYEDAIHLESPADRYVRLQKAWELAIDSSHSEVAWQAAAKLGEEFEGDPWQLQLQTLDGLAENVRLTEERLELAQRALVLADALIERRRHAEAAPAAELALSLGRRARSAAFQIQARQTLADIDRLALLEAANTEALTVLATKPDDPVALLHRGKYLCLVLGDWRGGLPMLAKTGIRELQAAVELDLAFPSKPEEQIAAADAWRNLAFADDEFAGFYSRALAWFTQAQPFVQGDQLEMIDRRLQEIARHKLSPRQIDSARVAAQALP